MSDGLEKFTRQIQRDIGLPEVGHEQWLPVVSAIYAAAIEEAAKVVHKFGKAAAKELLETAEGSERQYAAKAMWSILGSAEDAIRALAGKTEE